METPTSAAPCSSRQEFLPLYPSASSPTALHEFHVSAPEWESPPQPSQPSPQPLSIFHSPYFPVFLNSSLTQNPGSSSPVQGLHTHPPNTHTEASQEHNHFF